MRIRSIRPEFWRSEDITSLPLFERLLFIGIWSYVDDNGVGIDNVANIAADLFAHDLAVSPHDTLMQITGGLMLLNERGLITRYSVENKQYLHVSTWTTHQRISRPSTSRYPLPDAPNAVPHVNDMSPHANVPLGEGEKGRRGEGIYVQPEVEPRRTPPPSKPKKPKKARDYTPEFETFWATYPRRQGKGEAFDSFESALERTDLETIVTGAERLRDDPNRVDQFTPLPSTWLNQDRWDDGPLPPRTDGRGPTRLSQNMQVAQRAWQREQAQTRLEIEH